MLTLPDLLSREPTAASDTELLAELLETAFLGGDPGVEIDDALAATPPPASTWREEFFAEGLFLDELIEGCWQVAAGGRRVRVHARYLRRVLAAPPADAAGLRFRQEILRELAEDATARARVEALFLRLHRLLNLFKAPGTAAKLDYSKFRLELLEQAREVVDTMAADFASCSSGLSRLAAAGRAIQAGPEYARLAALLDWEGHLADLDVQVRVAPDGRIRRLRLERIVENRASPFHRGPLRRLWDRLRLALRGLQLDRVELVNRLIVAVYLEVAPAVRSLLQLIGPLELYLGALAFAEQARQRGLAVCLAEVADDGRLDLDGLFNPLLLRRPGRLVPCRIATRAATTTVVVTGPNSGGKTRMLQAVGLAQLLGQSGLYAPARTARIPLLDGLFVSLIEQQSADQEEGRLGSELLRIRSLFDEARPRSLILLDELCSGTNPAEAVRIIAMVLDLLRALAPVAFITTHFLDYARDLRERHRAADAMDFLQVEVDATQESTYQFVPGVAAASLAAHTAERLGVTFEQLSRRLRQRLGDDVPPPGDKKGGEHRQEGPCDVSPLRRKTRGPLP